MSYRRSVPLEQSEAQAALSAAVKRAVLDRDQIPLTLTLRELADAYGGPPPVVSGKVTKAWKALGWHIRLDPKTTKHDLLRLERAVTSDGVSAITVLDARAYP